MKNSRFLSTRYTMHVNMEILHPHFPKYKNERLQIPKSRFAKNISAFCEFRFLHLQNQKTIIRKYVITPFSNFENSRLRSLIPDLREITEKTNIKDHAVIKTSILVRFRLPVTSGSHTRHKLDQRSDEVRLRLSHRGANRPQTHVSVN